LNLVLNDEPFEAPAGATVASLLVALKLHEQRVAVELNKEVVPRQQHEAAMLREGDCLEIVTLVGGG